MAGGGTAAAGEKDVTGSAQVTVGGVPFALLIPQGYELFTEESPEFTPFRETILQMPKILQVLGIFLPQGRSSVSVGEVPAYAIAGHIEIIGGNGVTPLSFNAAKGTIKYVDMSKEVRDNLQAYLERGVPVDLSLVGTFAETDTYLATAAVLPGPRPDKALAAVSVAAVVDAEYMVFYFYAPLESADSLPRLKEDVSRYIGRYADAGRLRFTTP